MQDARVAAPEGNPLTRDERDTIRAAVDAHKRTAIANDATASGYRRSHSDAYLARRARLMAACATGSTVDRSNHVRSVMRMIDQAAKRNHA